MMKYIRLFTLLSGLLVASMGFSQIQNVSTQWRLRKTGCDSLLIEWKLGTTNNTNNYPKNGEFLKQWVIGIQYPNNGVNQVDTSTLINAHSVGSLAYLDANLTYSNINTKVENGFRAHGWQFTNNNRTFTKNLDSGVWYPLWYIRVIGPGPYTLVPAGNFYSFDREPYLQWGPATTNRRSNPRVVLGEVGDWCKTWLGITSDWNVASNWCPSGVPTASNCVVIPAGTPNQPTLSNYSYSDSIHMEDVVILNGQTLEINGSNTYDGATPSVGRFRGDPSANLIIQDNGLQGNIRMVRTSVNTRSLRNLTINRSSGARLNEDTYIHGILNPINGNLNANNDLILWATCDTCYAQIAPGGSGTISNNDNMWQSTWFSGNAGWRHLSSSGVASNYGGQSNVGGLFGDNVVLRLASKDSSNVWFFDKTDITWKGISSPLTPIHSAFAFFAGTVPGGRTITFPMRFGVIGEFNNLPYSVRRDTLHNPFSGAGLSGWNFIGNPYPAGWRWDASVSDIQGNAYSVWRDSINNWGTWNGSVSTNGAYEIIPPMTGIFVKYTGSGTKLFDWSTSRITTDKQKLYSSKDGVNDLVRLRIAGKGIKDADELIVYHNSMANDGFGNEDVEENFSNVNLSLSSREGSKSLAYNIRNAIPMEGSLLPLEVMTKSSGQFTISPAFENLLQIQTAELEDLFTGKIHNLMDGAYTFTATSFDRPNRFILHLNRKTSTGLGSLSANNNPVIVSGDGLNVYVNFPARREGMATVIVMDVLGRELTIPTEVDCSAGLHTFKMDVAAGYYLVRVNQGGTITTGKVFLSNK